MEVPPVPPCTSSSNKPRVVPPQLCGAVVVTGHSTCREMQLLRWTPHCISCTWDLLTWSFCLFVCSDTTTKLWIPKISQALELLPTQAVQAPFPTTHPLSCHLCIFVPFHLDPSLSFLTLYFFPMRRVFTIWWHLPCQCYNKLEGRSDLDNHLCAKR